MSNLAQQKILSITEKLLSWPGRLRVADDHGTILYECVSQWTLFRRRWTLQRGEQALATCERSWWPLAPSWTVQTATDRYRVRRAVWTLRRREWVEGGPFDGAELTGNLWDLSFTLSYQGRILARAQDRLLTLRDRQDVVLLDTSPEAELLTVILMANLKIDKRDERSAD
jgi:uncharacterized protein YxjI